MKRITLGTLLLFHLAAVCYSQSFTQTVKGQITDEQSGSPIIGATVMIANTDPPQGAISDLNGYYRIEEVAIGRQTILISYTGFEAVSIPNVLVGSGKEVVINAKLIESLQQLEEVVVTATDQQIGQPNNELATVSAISLGISFICGQIYHALITPFSLSHAKTSSDLGTDFALSICGVRFSDLN